MIQIMYYIHFNKLVCRKFAVLNSHVSERRGELKSQFQHILGFCQTLFLVKSRFNKYGNTFNSNDRFNRELNNEGGNEILNIQKITTTYFFICEFIARSNIIYSEKLNYDTDLEAN